MEYYCILDHVVTAPTHKDYLYRFESSSTIFCYMFLWVQIIIGLGKASAGLKLLGLIKHIIVEFNLHCYWVSPDFYCCRFYRNVSEIIDTQRKWRLIWSTVHHYVDVIMGAIASQITSLTIVYSTVHSDADEENIKAPRHWPLCGEFTGEMFPLDDVIMYTKMGIWWVLLIHRYFADADWVLYLHRFTC